MSSKRRNLSALVFLLNLITKVNLNNNNNNNNNDDDDDDDDDDNNTYQAR